MYKYELLRLLDEPDVKSKILKIVEASKKVSLPEENFPPQNDYREKISLLERQLEILRGENLSLKNSLAQAKNFQQEAADFKRAYESEKNRADAAQIKISELEEQLQARFARGWELFKKYREVGAHARQLLQGVFTRDNFTSFICGGAQNDSLEKIWDVLRECVMNSRQHDAEILWAVFEYCLELVNASKAQASYSILPVNIGDRFDSDLHTEAPGSRAQGKVARVYLPGFRNDYNRRIIKKSIVQVS